MSSGGRRIGDALLDRYLAEALPPGERARLTQVLETSPDDRARLSELRAESAAFLLRFPPGAFEARLRERSRRGRWWRTGALALPVLAGALAAVLVVSRPPEEPDFVVKGGVSLAVYARRPEGMGVKVSPGEPLGPGTPLRFEVRAPRPGHVALLSRDRAGKVTVYHPFEGVGSVPYEPSRPLLSTAIELDEGSVDETLFALYSERPFSLDWAVRALEQGRALLDVAPQGVQVATFELGRR